MQLDGALDLLGWGVWILTLGAVLSGVVAIIQALFRSPGDPHRGPSAFAGGMMIVSAGLLNLFYFYGQDLMDLVYGSDPGVETPPEPAGASWAQTGQVLPWVGIVVGVVVVLLVLGVVGRGVWRRHTRARDVRALVTERLTAMRATINTIADRIGEIQSDPVASLELYGLFDTKVASASEFWTRWISVTDRVEEAERLHEVPEGLRGDVEQIQRVWKRAHADAERAGLNAVGADRVAGARRAVKAVRLAQSTNSDAEAAMAWRRAADLLAALHLPHLPDSIHATIEAGHRAALTTGGAA